MILFNNTNYIAFVYGYIIRPNDIFKIGNFNLLVNLIRQRIPEGDLTRIMNGVFTPIKPVENLHDPNDVVKTLELYENIMFSEFTESDHKVIFDIHTLDLDVFMYTWLNKPITNDHLVLLDTDINCT